MILTDKNDINDKKLKNNKYRLIHHDKIHFYK